MERESGFSSGRSFAIASPVFATPIKEVKTEKAKLETSVDNKPCYAAPAVRVKADIKPSVSVKKTPVGRFPRCRGR